MFSKQFKKERLSRFFCLRIIRSPSIPFPLVPLAKLYSCQEPEENSLLLVTFPCPPQSAKVETELSLRLQFHCTL